MVYGLQIFTYIHYINNVFMIFAEYMLFSQF